MEFANRPAYQSLLNGPSDRVNCKGAGPALTKAAANTTDDLLRPRGGLGAAFLGDQRLHLSDGTRLVDDGIKHGGKSRSVEDRK